MPDPITHLNAALEGRYRIERQLGEGGMATVYLADDLRHARKVALKVLKPELAAIVGPERFLAEIETTANLNHPHILPLHDSGEANGFLFYVMPYVEGESLRERLDREHQLPVDEAVQIAKNVAEALDYAHARGVIHRDIKPANILLQAGKPVVSDFGIALAVGEAGRGRLTETGLSLGTPHYMSPEQATGDLGVGPPADIYALGCVLYEMLVGSPPFVAGTVQAVLGKIVTGEAPSARGERKSVPLNVDAAIRKALEKVPADRFRAAQDFARSLSNTEFRHRLSLTTSEQRPAGVPLASRLSAALGILVVALSTALVWVLATQPSVTSGVVRSTFHLPEGDRLSMGDLDSPSLALSPDGQNLVYIGNRSGIDRLYHRPFDRDEARPIPGTEGATGPFFSPDGEWIGFFSDGALRKVPLSGGLPVAVCEIDAVPHGATWGPDDMIYFGLHGQSISRVPSDGGTPVLVTTLDPATGVIDHHAPQLLPDGSALLFTRWRQADEASHVAVRRLVTGEERDLVTGSNSRYVSTGHLIFVRGTVLWAVGFDADRLEVVGEPFAMIEDLSSFQAPSTASGAQFAIASNGTLVYAPFTEGGSTLVRVNRDGQAAELLNEPDEYWYPRVSPDGTRLAVGIGPDIHAMELDRLSPINLTFGSAQAQGPYTWTADSRQVAFAAPASDSTNAVYVVAADGTGIPEPLFSGEQRQFPTSFAPNNRTLAFYVTHPETGRDLWMAASPMTDPEPSPLVTGPFEERAPRLSPDGRWVAYVSDESGRDEVYLLPAPGQPGRKEAVSRNGGTEPVWSADGGELFYRNGAQMLVVEITSSPGLRVGIPQELFSNERYLTRTTAGAGNAYYDVLADGEGFVMMAGDLGPTQFTVVLNFFEELKRLAPIN